MFASTIKTTLKQSWVPCVSICVCALIMAVCTRMAMGVLESQGAMAYIYATSGTGTILEQMCEIFTGGTVIALLAIGGIVGSLVAAFLCVAGVLYKKQTMSSASTSTAAQFSVFALWMLVAVIVIAAVAAIVVLGVISDVQIRSVSSKLGGGASGSSMMAPLALLMLWTVLLMGLGAVFAIISTSVKSKKQSVAIGIRLVVATAVIGAIQVFLGANMFMQFNVLTVNYGALNGWIGASIVVQCLIAAGGCLLAARMTSKAKEHLES